MTLQSSEARALEAAETLFSELAETYAEARFVEAGEYTDPGDFADAVLNNLPAISYALNAGLPVTAWSPVQKNGSETERVLRAVRQWSEQARALIERYANGLMTQDQLWAALADLYARQSTNAFVAGRRAVGNLSPLTDADQALLAAQQKPDLSRLQASAATGGEGGGALSMLVQSIFDPTNFFGSGLPGDPFSHKAEAKAGAKLATTLGQRVEQYGRSISSVASLGEMSGLSDLPEDVVIVWWELGDTDHCVDCIQLADLSPYLEKTLLDTGIFPGSGHTQCGSNCGCALNYDIPSEVCGDSLSGLQSSDVIDDIGESVAEHSSDYSQLLPSNDGTRFAVWVQEASSCALPISVGSFAGDVTALDILDDDEAFEWDDDIAMAMEGDLDETAVDLATADAAKWGWLTEYLPPEVAAVEKISRLAMKADNVSYEFAWRETADAVTFDFGRTTKGLTTLDPDMTLRALSQLSDRAALRGVPLRINAETAGPGMQRWLDSIATDTIEGKRLAPTVVPKWDLIPNPVTAPVESAKPGLADALARIEATPATIGGEGVSPLGSLVKVAEAPSTAEPGSVVITKIIGAADTRHVFATQYDDLGNPVAILDLGATKKYDPTRIIGVRVRDDAAGQGWATRLYDYVQDNTEYNLYPIAGKQTTDAGHGFVASWLRHRVEVEAKAEAKGAATVPVPPDWLKGKGAPAGEVLSADFVPAATVDEARARIDALLPKLKYDTKTTLTQMDLRQLNASLSAIEDLKRAGVTLDNVVFFGDTAAAKAAGTTIGTQLGKTVNDANVLIRQSADWSDVPQGLAGTVRHEIGHTVLNTLSAGTQDRLAAARKLFGAGDTERLLGGYAKEAAGGQIEWISEYFRVLTGPGYRAGDLPGDAAFWDELVKAGRVSGPLPGSGAAADILPALTGPVATQVTRSEAIDLASVLGAEYQGWARTLTAEERKAFELYQADSGGSVAAALRKGTSTKLQDALAQKMGLPTMAERLDAMDAAIARGALPQDVAAYGGADISRVFRGATDRHGVPKVGSVVTDPGYMSTSIDPQVAVKFAADRAEVQGGTPLVYRIGLPEGETGVYLDEFFGGDLGYEREILLPRNSSFRVEAVTADADLGNGLKGYVVDMTPVPEPVVAVLSSPPTKQLLPASMRATASEVSYVGTNRAVWAAAFRPAKTFDEAVERVGDLISGKNHLDGFSLSQLNVILARAEGLEAQGFDLARITRLDDFTKVPSDVRHGRVGLTKGHTIAIREDTKWQYFPEQAMNQHPTVYDDVGGAFAHEYGHVLLADMSAEGKKELAAIRAANPNVALSDYAKEDLDEWMGEVMAAITTPGYKRGDIAFDQDVYALLGREHLLTQPKVDLVPIGPPKVLEEPALGIKPGDAQMYLVSDNPLPVNAPVAEWSGFIPEEPALPAGLKASKAEIDAAKAEANDAWLGWRDVASGKVDVALTWSAAEREAGERAGLIYREVKPPGAKQSVRFVAHDATAADKAEAWLMEPGHSSNSDDFWTEVLGYTPERLATIDRADEIAKGGKRLSAGVVMVEPDGKVWVLAPKNEFAGYQNTWVKGGVDEGETAAQAAVREMREEAGFSVELDAYLGDYVNTDKTGMTRMYVGHRTGGGPIDAHLKETYKMRLLDEDEAAKLLTRYGKPDARDQTILADAMKAIKGEAPTTHYVIGADEVGEFRDMVSPKVYPKKIGEPPGQPKRALEFAINPRPVLSPAPSAQFAFDHDYIHGISKAVVETPGSTKAFPYNTSTWKLPSGEQQKMFWKIDPASDVPALTSSTEKPGLAQALTSIKSASPNYEATATDWSTLLSHVPESAAPGTMMEVPGAPWQYAVRYGDDGKPAAITQLGINEYVQNGVAKRELLTIEAVRTDPTKLGQGHATALYDWLQDSTDLNLYAATGTTVTEDGKAFVEKWLEHRQTLASAAPKGPIAGKRIYWANSKLQVPDPHLRYNLHVGQLKNLLAKMDAEQIGALRVSEDLLGQVPQLREMLVAAGAETGATAKWVELNANDAMKLRQSLEANVPLPKPEPAIPAAPLVPAPKPAMPLASAGTYLDAAVPAEIDPSPFADHVITWPSPSGGFQTSWRWDDAFGIIGVDGQAMTLTPGDEGAFLAAQLLLVDNLIEKHPGILGPQYVHFGSGIWPSAKSRLAAAGAANEMGIEFEVLSTGKWRFDVQELQTWAAKVKGEMGDAGLDPSLLKVDWTPLGPVGTPPGAAAIPEAAVDTYSAPAVAAAAQATVSDSALLKTAMTVATDEKVKFLGAPMTKTRYLNKFDTVTWRRLGNVLEVHAVETGAASTSAHLIRMAKVMDEAPKVSGLRFTNAALGGMPKASRDMLEAAGGNVYAGGLKLDRSQVLALRDQLLASASASEAKATEELVAKIQTTIAQTVYVPTDAAGHGLYFGDIGKLDPTIIPQKQGFTKVEYAAEITPVGSVRTRQLSKEIVFSGLTGTEMADTMLAARFRMLRKELQDNPAIERIRFDPAGLSVAKGNMPANFEALIYNYGGHTVGDVLYLEREQAYKLALDIEYETKAALGQLAPGKAAVADVVAASPAPASAVAPDFWAESGIDPGDLITLKPSIDKVDFASWQYDFPSGSTGAAFQSTTGGMQVIVGPVATPAEALTILDNINAKVVAGDFPSLKVYPSTLTAMGPKAEKLLIDLGGTPEGSSILMSKAAADNLWHAMHGNLSVAEITANLAPPPSSLAGTKTLSSQFGIDASALPGLSGDSKATLLDTIGFGDLDEGIYGVGWSWEVEQGYKALKLTINVAEDEQKALGVVMGATDILAEVGGNELILDIGAKQQTMVTYKLADILQAAGAKPNQFKTEWTLTLDQAQTLGEAIANDTPLPRLKLGSAVTNTPDLQPSIVDLLKPEHPQYDDAADWAGTLAKPKKTIHAGTSVDADGKPVSMNKAVNWFSPGNKLVTASLYLSDMTGSGAMNHMVWKALSSPAQLPAGEWASVAIGEFHDLAAKLNYSGTGVFGEIDTIVLDSLLVGSVPETKTIALAFGGVEKATGDIVLTPDQVKAIGKAIEDQIVNIPNGPAQAAANRLTKKVAGGWDPAKAAQWWEGKPDGISLLGASDPGPFGSHITFLSNSTQALAAGGGQIPELKAVWETLTNHSLQWQSLTSSGAVAVAGDDLTAAAGQFLHKLVAEAADGNLQVFVAYDVLDGLDPAIGKLLMDAGGQHITAPLGQWQNLKGIHLDSSSVQALASKLDAEVPNPLGAVAPAAVPSAVPVGLDYDAADIALVLQNGKITTADLGGGTVSLAIGSYGLTYKKIGNLATITSTSVPFDSDLAMASVVGGMLTHAKAEGLSLVWDEKVLAHPGLKQTLKDLGAVGGEGQATAVAFLPEHIQPALDKLLGGAPKAGPTLLDQVLEPTLQGVDPGPLKKVFASISLDTSNVLDTPMAQGFGKLGFPGLEVKYRASASAITVKSASGFADFAAQLKVLVKVGEKVDATPGITSVKFEKAWLDKSDLSHQLMLLGGGAGGDPLTFDREAFLKLRDAVVADLKGLPAPVGSAAPVAGIVDTTAKAAAPNYDVAAVAGKGYGDIQSMYDPDLKLQGLQLENPSTVAYVYDSTIASWHMGGGATLADGTTLYKDDAFVFDHLMKPGADPKHAILSMMSALGSEVEGGGSYALFLSDEVLDASPGLARTLGAYGQHATMSFEPGLYIANAQADDLLLHLYQGVPIASVAKVAPVIPPPTIAEPLATKVGWDMGKIADITPQPVASWESGPKERTLIWQDTTGVVGQPGTKFVARYREYDKRLIIESPKFGPYGTDQQKAAVMWRHLSYVTSTQGKSVLLTDDLIAAFPEIGKVADLYGAKAGKYLKYSGRELSPAQAKQLTEDMANNAAIKGAPSPAAAIPVTPAAAPIVPKTAAQIEQDAIDEIVSASKVGTKQGLTNLSDESLHAYLFGDIEQGTAIYTDASKLPKAKLQWSSDGWGKTFWAEDIDPPGGIGAKVALADIAKAADESGAKLLINDSIVQNMGLDDMGGVLYWAPGNDMWTTSQPGKLADYMLGKAKPPAGAPLTVPVAAAPPPVPTVAAVAAVAPPASGMGDVYGYDHAAAKAMADTLSSGPSVKTAILNDTPLTKTYESTWASGVAVKWAEEQQGDARILRVRSLKAVDPTATAATKANTLVASLMAEWPAYLGTHPDVARVLINKTALTDTAKLGDMLKDAGWKETKEYWVLGRDGIGDMSVALDADKAEWAATNVIPTSTPAGGWSGALPTTPSPSFIYDYNPATHQSLYGQIVDKDIGPLDLGGGVGQGHELTVGKIKVTWSTSPSGQTILIGKIEVDPTAASHEKVDATMAAFQYLAEKMAGRTGNFMIKPDLYQTVPGLAQIMKDAGATEQATAKIGDVIQMNAAEATVLATALKTDNMAGLSISISTSSEYLSYNKDLAATMFGKEPADLGKGVLRYETGATGAAKTAEARIALSADGKVGELTDIKAAPSVATITVAGQINWFVQHGATDVLISNSALAKVPKLDKYLVSLGGKIENGGIRLTDKALYDTRSALVKNALPVPLGGDPKSFAFSVMDSMIAAPNEVLQAVHSELVADVGAKTVSEYLVGGRKIKVSYAKSNGNIFWEAVDRGDASIGQARSASVAQLRTFLNDMGQNASLQRLDVGLDVLADQPGLRDVLRKYGAKEVAATSGHPAYLSLERPNAMKLRKDVEKELGGTFGSGPVGSTPTFIQQQAALIEWPVADELKASTKALGGQTAKNVFVDAKGNEWMFKPGASGQGGAADKAAAEIAALMGLPVPPVRLYTLEVNGKLVQGSLQKMIPGAKGIEHTPLSSLTAAQQAALWQHSALDWVIANDDAHVGNWLIDPDGNFWGIDKTRAWKTFGDPRRDVLDIASNGQGGSDIMAPSFFKWWRDAKKNPALLQQVHPTTITKPLRALREVDDATYRSIVTPFAKIAADGNPKYKGDWAKMVEDMVARKNSAPVDLEQFIAKNLTEMKRAGTAIPAEWDQWLRSGGKLNLDATPDDLLRERLLANQTTYHLPTDAKGLKAQISSGKFSKVQGMMTSGYGSGVQGATSGAGKVAFGAGHKGARGYGYEKVRPTLRSTPAGAQLAAEWEAINENLIIHALFDTDTSWAPSDWVKRVRDYYNPDKGTIRVIRTTSGYGTPQKSLEGYTRDGFRNLFSTALGAHVNVGGHGVNIYADVEPRQIFTSPFAGFGSGESELAVADMRIDQVVYIADDSHRLSSGYTTDAKVVMGYNGPVVSGP